MLGNQALFTRSDGIERLWEISEDVLAHPPAVQPYAKGSWGPELDPAARRPAPVVPRRSEHPPIRLVVSDVDGTLVTSTSC